MIISPLQVLHAEQQSYAPINTTLKTDNNLINLSGTYNTRGTDQTKVGHTRINQTSGLQKDRRMVPTAAYDQIPLYKHYIHIGYQS